MCRWHTVPAPPDFICWFTPQGPSSWVRANGSAKAWRGASASMAQAAYWGRCPGLAVRAICVTSNDVSDAASMPQLLGQRPATEPWPTIKDDGAYFCGEVLFEVDCRLLAGGASSLTSLTADFFRRTRVPGYLLLGSSVHSRYRAEAALGDISTSSERSVAERQS